MAMSFDERFELVKRNVAEIISEEQLKDLLNKKKKPVVYCGYEPSGPLHLGHFVTITKLMDLAEAGFKVKILLADIHAMLNRKGSEDEIKKEVAAWRRTVKAIGVDVEVVLGSDFQFSKNYQFDVMKLSQHSTINRGLRSMQEIARDVKNATISQLWYPLMQIADIKALKVDVALGGLEQRKVHVLGKDLKRFLDYDFIVLHTPLITSLKGPGEKMSSSVEGSNISVIDSKDKIKKTLSKAYCPAGDVKENPVLQIAEFIIFPRVKKFMIRRPENFGGDYGVKDYRELAELFKKGDVHPLDLKNSVAEHLEEIIAPIRKNFR